MTSLDTRVGTWPRARSLLRLSTTSNHRPQEQDAVERVPQDGLRTATMRGRLSRLSKIGIPGKEVELGQTRASNDSIPVSATSSSASSFKWDEKKQPADCRILYHGEVITSISIWRTVTEYVVLTESALFIYPNRRRASIIFPDVAISTLQQSRTNSSLSTISSQGLQSPRQETVTWDALASGVRISLDDVFAIYNLYNTRPSFAVAIHWYDANNLRPQLYSFQLEHPDEKDMWITLISQYSRVARMYPETRSMWLDEPDLPEYEQKVFRIVRNIHHDLDPQRSNDSAQKQALQLEFLVVGENKFHFVPVAEHSTHKSYPLASLTSLEVFPNDDRLTITTRLPLEQEIQIECASVDSVAIAREVTGQLKYLRPNWRSRPWKLKVPQPLQRRLSSDQSYDCNSMEAFNRTMNAYCVAYNVDKTRIRYEIRSSGDDAPAFRLLPLPKEAYSFLELLAVLRSLRYSDMFVSMSFANVLLDSLNKTLEAFGKEHLDWVANIPKRKDPLPYKFSGSTVLGQEIAAIAVTNSKLLRLDLSNSLSLLSSVKHSSGVLKALYPLCQRECTNVEWLNLHGLHLNQVDIESLHYVVKDRRSHLRGLDLSRTYLGSRALTSILRELKAQENTLEVLDFSENGAGLDESEFDTLVSKLPYLRVLRLNLVTLTPSVQEPLISASTFKSWRLQELSFSDTSINAATVHALCLYLQSPSSMSLRILKVDGASLRGTDVARLLEGMAQDNGTARNLHLAAGSNDLHNGFPALSLTLRNGWAPRSLNLSETRLSEEFQVAQLFAAVKENSTIQELDLSNLQLKVRPNSETDMSNSFCTVFPGLMGQTLRSVQKMLADNWTLRSLNVSIRRQKFSRLRDEAVVSQVITQLLEGLKLNKRLQKLDISGHNLSEEDTNLLHDAIVYNPNLTEVRCEDVMIPLEGFRRLVDAVQNGRHVTYLSDMEFAKEENLDDFSTASSPYRRYPSPPRINRKQLSELERRSFTTSVVTTLNQKFGTSRSRVPQVRRPSPHKLCTSPSLEAQQRAAWEVEQARLAKYLERNKKRARGEPIDDEWKLIIVDECNEVTKEHYDSSSGEESPDAKGIFD